MKTTVQVEAKNYWRAQSTTGTSILVQAATADEAAQRILAMCRTYRMGGIYGEIKFAGTMRESTPRNGHATAKRKLRSPFDDSVFD